MALRKFRKGTRVIQVINVEPAELRAFQRACFEISIPVTEAMRRLIHKVAEGDEALFSWVVK